MSFSPDFNICWTRITQDLGFPGNSVGQEAAVVQSSAAFSPGQSGSFQPALRLQEGREGGNPTAQMCSCSCLRTRSSPSSVCPPGARGEFWAGVWGLSQKAVPPFPVGSCSPRVKLWWGQIWVRAGGSSVLPASL